MGIKGPREGSPETVWMDLRALTKYAAVSERTIREWIHRQPNPLPAVQVGKKILIHRQEFDRWLGAHPLRPAEAIDVDGVIRDMMTGLMESA